jgi:hypothetical protein
MRLTTFSIRYGDIGSEIPMNLLHNNVAISPGTVDTATLLLKHSGGVHAMVMSPPGESEEFPEQWTYQMTEDDFETLGKGEFYAEVKIVLEGGLGIRTIPTEKGLRINILGVLDEPNTP